MDKNADGSYCRKSITSIQKCCIFLNVTAYHSGVKYNASGHILTVVVVVVVVVVDSEWLWLQLKLPGDFYQFHLAPRQVHWFPRNRAVTGTTTPITIVPSTRCSHAAFIMLKLLLVPLSLAVGLDYHWLLMSAQKQLITIGSVERVCVSVRSVLTSEILNVENTNGINTSLKGTHRCYYCCL